MLPETAICLALLPIRRLGRIFRVGPSEAPCATCGSLAGLPSP
jgi:hypothetical protein